MKDIKKEVDALEVAMQVATDIKDKPYAYVVARIQEALLGKSEIQKSTPLWNVKVTKGSDSTHRLWIGREGFLYSCMLIPNQSITIANSFCQDLENLQLETSGTVFRSWEIWRKDMVITFVFSNDNFLTKDEFHLQVESPGSKVILDALAEDLIQIQKLRTKP